MEITVTFRHMEPTMELRSYVEEKVYRIKKYFDSPVDAHIVLEVQKFRHIADMTLSIDGNKVKWRNSSGGYGLEKGNTDPTTLRAVMTKMF